MLRDGQDHLYQELDVATAGSNAVPDLVFDTLDPGAERDAPEQNGILF